ncbi:hypothetical protein O1M63_41490 [Streptomyces mirabilis]|nr:hypothetical protein [Streptomyces mirabilis]
MTRTAAARSSWPVSCRWCAPRPHSAGVTRLPYRRIVPYSIAAACAWATAEAGVGYAAATSLQRVLTLGGPAFAAVALAVLGSVLLWRRRRRHVPDFQGPAPEPAAESSGHGQAGLTRPVS